MVSQEQGSENGRRLSAVFDIAKARAGVTFWQALMADGPMFRMAGAAPADVFVGRVLCWPSIPSPLRRGAWPCAADAQSAPSETIPEVG